MVRFYENHTNWLRSARQLKCQGHKLAEIRRNKHIARTRLHEHSNALLLPHLGFQHDLTTTAAGRKIQYRHIGIGYHPQLPRCAPWVVGHPH